MYNNRISLEGIKLDNPEVPKSPEIVLAQYMEWNLGTHV